jgi:hypothetical protein
MRTTGQSENNAKVNDVIDRAAYTAAVERSQELSKELEDTRKPWRSFWREARELAGLLSNT